MSRTRRNITLDITQCCIDNIQDGRRDYERKHIARRRWGILAKALKVWFKNRRAKWRKQKREEQERVRKLQEEHTSTGLRKSEICHIVDIPDMVQHQNFTDDDSSDLEVA